MRTYDQVATEYKATDELPYREYLEKWLIENQLRELKKCRSLDLACGNGFYTNILFTNSFRPVLGVDSSAEMLALAEKSFKNNNDISFVHSCVNDFESDQEFDLIAAGFLINYCSDVLHLKQVCKKLYSLLSNNGTILTTIDFIGEKAKSDMLLQYSEQAFHDRPLKDGETFKLRFLTTNPCDIQVTHYSEKTITDAFSSAGFEFVEWIPLSISPKGIKEKGSEYWNYMFESKPIRFLKIKKHK
ncbi:class I SAM-dependent DNA methyltransferase [Cysteiniphilum marinum]|uniref:class I SAM-dependent DNA methyltransferase n=1 Tax=Cysteiniphilum marinum TaxID=2774191 RepID=UPI00193C1B9C|nr:class I SAM-dependent methyltransferase [Cysteiniphilum marinum]